MNETSHAENCPCGSGLNFGDCCGVEGRQAVSADIMLRLDENGNISGGVATPQLQEALDTLAHDPALFPARLNFADGKAWFVKMSPQWYRESVFLDPARIKGTYVVEMPMSWLREVCDRITWQPTSFIFHTAFCGSTLMAQAMESLYHCLPLREPEALGNVQYFVRNTTVSAEERQQWFDRIMRLISRRYNSQQRVLIKANDFSNPVMTDLLSRDYKVPLLFMFTPLHEFVAGCLRADNRREWIRDRTQAIRNVVPAVMGLDHSPQPDADDYGAMAAIYWSYNIALLQKAMSIDASRIRTLDFNDVLEQPLDVIQACAQFLELQPLPDIDVESEIARLFGTYSKDNKYRYSPGQRALDIEQALANNQQHLDSAQAMARRLLGDAYPDEGLPGKLLQ